MLSEDGLVCGIVLFLSVRIWYLHLHISRQYKVKLVSHRVNLKHHISRRHPNQLHPIKQINKNLTLQATLLEKRVVFKVLCQAVHCELGPRERWLRQSTEQHLLHSGDWAVISDLERLVEDDLVCLSNELRPQVQKSDSGWGNFLLFIFD